MKLLDFHGDDLNRRRQLAEMTNTQTQLLSTYQLV